MQETLQATEPGMGSPVRCEIAPGCVEREESPVRNTDREEWVPTHRIRGQDVIKRERFNGSLPAFFDREGKRIGLSRFNKAIPIPASEALVKPVDPIEAAYKAGYQKALEEMGKAEEDADRSAAEFAVPQNMHAFRTRDVAAALYALLAAHEGGNSLIIDGNMCEGQFRAVLPDGSYHCTARVWNWAVRGHHVFQVRIPAEMMLEVLDVEVP
jgi:hypothetical protein